MEEDSSFKEEGEDIPIEEEYTKIYKVLKFFQTLAKEINGKE